MKHRGTVVPKTRFAPREKKDSMMLPVSESTIMQMSKEETVKPKINDW